MSDPELLDIRERLVRIETMLQTHVDEIPTLRNRILALEKWQSKSIGIAVAVSGGFSLLFSYLLKSGAIQ